MRNSVTRNVTVIIQVYSGIKEKKSENRMNSINECEVHFLHCVTLN